MLWNNYWGFFLIKFFQNKIKKGYTEEAGHKDTHDKFVTQVLAVQKSFHDGGDLSADVLAFLKDWLVSHIKGTDQKYGSWFNSHGVN